jgi:N-acetylmuramoyl-L-alanine amidase
VKVVISSAHGKKIRGARGLIDEVEESRKVVTQVADELRALGVEVVTFDDDTSTTVSTNIRTIVAAHNREKRDLDVSVHFNSYRKTETARGTEVLYRTQHGLAARVSWAITAASGLIDRGAKKRINLGFLNGVAKPAILIEVCFVDSAADVRLYQTNFAAICRAIAEAIIARTAKD